MAVDLVVFDPRVFAVPEVNAVAGGDFAAAAAGQAIADHTHAVGVLDVHAKDGVLEAAVRDANAVGFLHAHGRAILDVRGADILEDEPADHGSGRGDGENVAGVLRVDDREILAEQDQGHRDHEAVLII
jgi:hypothetical protein